MLRAFLITFGMLLLSAAAALGLRFGPDLLAGRPKASPAVEIGGIRLVIPAAFLRASETVPPGEAAVALAWPGLMPAGGTASGIMPAVFISLVRADDAIDPAERTMTLYARFFAAENWSNPGGLVMRRFRAGTPYQDEELYFAPPDGTAFSARCPRQGTVGAIGTAGCLWLVRLRGLDIRVRFPPEILPDWQQLRAGIDGLLGEWIAAAG